MAILAIAKAKEAYENSGHSITDHFVEANKMVKLGSGSQRKTEDYHLSGFIAGPPFASPVAEIAVPE